MTELLIKRKRAPKQIVPDNRSIMRTMIKKDHNRYTLERERQREGGERDREREREREGREGGREGGRGGREGGREGRGEEGR